MGIVLAVSWTIQLAVFIATGKTRQCTFAAKPAVEAPAAPVAEAGPGLDIAGPGIIAKSVPAREEDPDFGAYINPPTKTAERYFDGCNTCTCSGSMCSCTAMYCPGAPRVWERIRPPSRP